ncbi:MAG: serine/threonine protein kinase [Planctomycetaceae bacterium]|nr:serine/threonine protein kinase [Planctomycetaceae bacterium]
MSEESPEESSQETQHTLENSQESTVAQQDLSGLTLGEFRLLRRLGKGGMANVYLAEQTALNRHVAIKVMKNDLVTDATYLDRFKTEAMAAANLNHINIVQVYTIGEANGYHFIAQEYVQGMNLRDFITRKGPPELSVALHIIRQIASALQKASDVGIVHRDIKPENILISRKGVVKIADFGLAQLTLSGERMNLTQEGVTMGTPLYMSPEQVKGNKVDHRSDIYSLGVTCYHMFAGRPPFRGQTAIAIAMKHVNSQPAPLAKRRPDLPPAVCEVVHKMMAKKVNDRYQDAGELLQDLKKLAKVIQGEPGEVSLSAFESNTGQVSEATVLKPANRLKSGPSIRKFILIGLLFLVAGGALGVAARPRLNAEPALNAVQRDSAREQFADAMLEGNSEDAWKALRVHHANTAERWQAEERLAILYLNQGRLDEASHLFETFIEQDANDRFNLVPVGYAGRAIIATMKGNYSQSDTILESNSKRISEKLSGPTKPLVVEAMTINATHLEKPRMTVEKMFPEDLET